MKLPNKWTELKWHGDFNDIAESIYIFRMVFIYAGENESLCIFAGVFAHVCRLAYLISSLCLPYALAFWQQAKSAHKNYFIRWIYQMHATKKHRTEHRTAPRQMECLEIFGWNVTCHRLWHGESMCKNTIQSTVCWEPHCFCVPFFAHKYSEVFIKSSLNKQHLCRTQSNWLLGLSFIW